MIVTWREIGLCHVVWWIVVQRTLTATETVATAMLLLSADHRFGAFGVTLSHRASAVMVALGLMYVSMADAASVPTAGDFRIRSEFPATASQPYTANYATLLLESTPPLPAGTRFLRLAIDDPGPGNATAAPLEWAEVGTHARLMLAPNNYSAQGAWGSPAPSWVQPIKGSVVVHAEAWSDRVGGKQLGVSNTLELYFDHTFSSIRFLPPVVTSLGPGEGLIEFPARAEDAARLAKSAELFFFCRVGPTGNHTAAGVPTFSNNCANQYQFASNRFRVAWSQPGVYYIMLNGAWNGCVRPAFDSFAADRIFFFLPTATPCTA